MVTSCSCTVAPTPTARASTATCKAGASREGNHWPCAPHPPLARPAASKFSSSMHGRAKVN